MLTVYKASAGSGKTFQLVVEYLKLLVANPSNYKHILAVTFTNKATNEMKSRILEQLYALAQNEGSDYLPVLTEELKLPQKMIRQRAKVVLKNILHDYNRFSVNTIDSFTQRVIKAFNREMGISPNFTLELDDSMILEEAVDRLLSKIDSDAKLRKWLVQFSEEKIKENHSQQIETDIKALGKELFNEKFQLFFPEANKSEYTRENLEMLRNELYKIIAGFENTIAKMAKEAVASMHDSDFSFNDFSYKLSGVAGYIKKLSEGTIYEPGARVLQAEEDPLKWFAKNHKEKVALQFCVEHHLHPQLCKILDFYRSNSIEYNTAIVVKKQLRMLGILTDLKEEIRLLANEKGVLQISDSNLLLSRIIGNSESPFIYEKIGNHFRNFMLDEFQDTSALQWNNFKPLIANSLSEGNNNLLVGDVKQSVYRWRNSDWNILATGIQDAFPGFPPAEKPLEKNWRSEKNIIDFNNAVTGSLKTTFEESLFEKTEPEIQQVYREKFGKIYEHFLQQPGKPERERKGFAKVEFFPEEDFEEQSNLKLVEEVKQLQDKGLQASEIAILIRRNNEGAKIIETFLAAAKQEENAGYNLSVLSNESLFLHASKGVNFVIFTVELLVDPQNKITKAAMLHLWKSWLEKELKKSGIILNGKKSQLAFDFISETEKNSPLDINFENKFDELLQPVINEIKEKVLLLSLDETITEICASFHLFQVESELPFLQTLIDKAAEIKKTVSNDLSNLLYWWAEKGNQISVSVNENTNSVRLLTIHKSKGLEFSAVLIPHFNWNSSWSPQYAPLLWCSSGKAPFNRFPLLPVKAAEELKETFFKFDYYDEKASSFIDTLNLVYVAFTRAKSVLMIHCKDNGTKNSPGKFVNGLLKDALKQMEAVNSFAQSWNSEKTVFSFGEIPVFEPVQIKSNSNIIKHYSYNDFHQRIKLRLSSDGFLVKGEMNKSVKNWGKIIHEILSTVETAEDVEKACRKALHDGKINDKELDIIRDKIETGIKNPEVGSWFDGSYKILNERSLLTNQRNLRPDRMMFSGKNAVVVDYKLGEEHPEKYHAQVRQYARTLKQTGFEKVEGYLWYINQNRIEKVGVF